MEESNALFYFDHFAIFIAFAYSTRILVWLLFFRKPAPIDERHS